MERAGRIISRIKTAQKHFTAEDLVRAAWPTAIGKRLAGRTRAAELRGEKLIVEVEDELWQKNLYGLRRQILSNLNDLLDTAAPRQLEFRIGIQRRPPQRETAPASFSLLAPPTWDEADRIEDPVLRRIYLNSRRKALA